MDTPSPGNGDIARQVRHVRDAIANEFRDYIDLSDLSHVPGRDREPMLLTRALAAKVVKAKTGCTTEEAAAAVIDGRADYGIDAVAFSADKPKIWLVQSKWSDGYRAGFDTEAANKLVRGFRQMDEHAFGRFNERLQNMADRIAEVLADPMCEVVFVIAVMGPGSLSAEVTEILEDARRDFNILGRGLEYEVMNGQDFHQIIRDDTAPAPLTLRATMASGWNWLATPFPAYYGLVGADELAGWHEQYAERGLYRNNLRTSLGRTAVNDEIVRSLTDAPESFWYFHNGITVLCDEIVPRYQRKRAIGEPVEFELANATVVNGAQTVTSAHAAMRLKPDAVAEALVTVRIISVKDAPAGFDRAITMNTNTQNGIERRDYIAIDPVQIAIREDFRLSMHKDYTLRRGELDPSPEAGCSVVEAAIALACAHPNPTLSLRAKRPNLLWEQGERGTYELLFGQRPTADEVWRSVLLLREVRDGLAELTPRLTPRAAAIADEAQLLIAHAAFQIAGREGIDDPDSSWDEALVGLQDQAGTLLTLLMGAMGRTYGPTSSVSATFANDLRWRELARMTLHAFQHGSEDQGLESLMRGAEPKPPRRPNSVTLLVDAERIPDGTRLLFKPGSEVEVEALGSWLAAGPNRSVATWVNNRAKPLLWAEDGERYSPSGLVTHIWKLAEWGEAWVSIQGPRQWVVPGEGTLVELAERIWNATREGEDNVS